MTGLVAISVTCGRYVPSTPNSKSEAAILIVTFLSTLFLELEFAIYMGVLLSLVFFLKRTSTPEIPTMSINVDEKTKKRCFINIQKKPVKQCPQLKIIRIDMSIYFGSINHVQNRISHIVENEHIYHIMIDASRINLIDLAAAEALVSENNILKKYGGGLYFVGLKSSVYEFIAKSCFVKKIGADHFFDSKGKAISNIYNMMLDRKICRSCQSQIFKECNE
ncbi:MAG: STAS domain-containing protein [Woeseiaceae bacterium]